MCIIASLDRKLCNVIVFGSNPYPNGTYNKEEADFLLTVRNRHINTEQAKTALLFIPGE